MPVNTAFTFVSRVLPLNRKKYDINQTFDRLEEKGD